MPLPSTYEEIDQRTRALGEYLATSEFNGKPWTVLVEDSNIVASEDDAGHPIEKQTLTLVAAPGFSEPPWGARRSALCNVSNRQIIKAMFGAKDPNAVIGKRLTLYPTKARLKGTPVDAWRIAGSPDLKEPIQFQLVLPRRKPVTLKLVPTPSGHRRESGQD